jgi:hypothetical protein
MGAGWDWVWAGEKACCCGSCLTTTTRQVYIIHRWDICVSMTTSGVLRCSLSAFPARCILPQAPPAAPPHLLQYLPLGQQSRKHDHHVLLPLDHNRKIEAYLEPLERFVYEDVLDARRGDQARGGGAEVDGGRGASLEPEAAEYDQRFLYC